MGSTGFGDQPVVAAVDPSIEAMLAHNVDRLTRNIRGHRLFLQNRKIAFDKKPAVEAGNRRVELECIKQHGHAARWPTAGDGKADARVVQCTDGVLCALGQNLFLGDKCAVHVRQHE